MKIIFLDVDGVLNNAETHRSKEHHQTWPDWGYVGLDRRLVKRLNTLVEATDAKIVLSSTWRLHHTPDEMRERLVSAGMDPAIKILDRTPYLGREPRHREIEEWLKGREKSLGVKAYVIIDDDSDAEIKGHFVHTAHDAGLTDEDVTEAIKILGPKD